MIKGAGVVEHFCWGQKILLSGDLTLCTHICLYTLIPLLVRGKKTSNLITKPSLFPLNTIELRQKK